MVFAGRASAFSATRTLSWEVLTRFIPAMQLLWPFVLFFGALAVPSIHDDTTCTIPESQFLVSITARKNIIYVYIYVWNCAKLFEHFFYVIALRIDGFAGSISEKPRGPCRPVTGSSGWSRQIPFTPKGPAEPCCKVVPRWRSPGWIALLGTCLVWAKNHPLAGCFWSFRKHGVPLSYRRVSNSVWIWIHFLEEKRWCNTECIFWIHYIFFSSRYSCFLLAVQVLRKEWNRHGFSGHQFDVKFDAGHDIVSQSGAKTFLNLCLSNLVHFLVWRCTEMYTVETCWNQPK